MKLFTLSEQYEIVQIHESGKRIRISLEKEGIKEHDIIFLTNHPDLITAQYEVIKVNVDRGLVYADLLRLTTD